ncbi:MAG: tetrapyrrole methylase family protein / MazG family protein [Chloroflexota bacterium]|nr:tetrapyrrole methylase family protein / MazG family protein [Chloroflexota bacterium]
MLDALVAEARLRWRLDPAIGLQVYAAETLIGAPIEPSRPLLIVPLATLRAEAGEGDPVPLPGRAGPRGWEPIPLLRRLYPADHPVGRFGANDGTTLATLDAAALLLPIYLAPVAPELAVAGPWAMPWISARLRQPDGCPWDQEQTHTSLRKHLLEEAYEVYDALEAGATPELAGELGDLWLQIVLHAQLAAEAGVFDLADVQAAIASKIVRRHPHVFGDAVARTASDVNRQWERIKADERAAAAAEPGTDTADGDGAAVVPKSALDGISRSMPALAASQEMQERAANLGYDWPSIEGVLDKVAEEADELRRAANDAERAEEFGDLLFVLVNVARRRGIEAEAAVRSANAKFKRRFASVERGAAAQGVALRDLDFAALDALWDAAKAEERTS